MVFCFCFFFTKILKPWVWDQHPDQSRLNPPGMVPSNPRNNGINYQSPFRTGEFAGVLVAINSTKPFFASRSWQREMGVLQTKAFMEVASYPNNRGKSPMIFTLLKTNEYLLNNWWLVQMIHFLWFTVPFQGRHSVVFWHLTCWNGTPLGSQLLNLHNFWVGPRTQRFFMATPYEFEGYKRSLFMHRKVLFP